MYKLQSILPEDDFKRLLSEFSIDMAQQWLDSVRDKIGIARYDDIKQEFKAQEEKKKRKFSEMNCYANNKVCEKRKTIFQADIGANKYVKLDGEAVDNLFTGFFDGI